MVQQVKISEEYLETVCTWLEEWVEKPDSRVFPQFLAERGIGWKYFKQFLEISPPLNNIFQVVVCKLHDRWIKFAIEKKELSRHLQAILLRYIRVYDPHAYDMEIAAKKEIAESSNITFVKYGSENYGDSLLQGIPKELYEINDNKRRSRKKT